MQRLRAAPAPFHARPRLRDRPARLLMQVQRPRHVRTIHHRRTRPDCLAQPYRHRCECSQPVRIPEWWLFLRQELRARALPHYACAGLARAVWGRLSAPGCDLRPPSPLLHPGPASTATPATTSPQYARCRRSSVALAPQHFEGRGALARCRRILRHRASAPRHCVQLPRTQVGCVARQEGQRHCQGCARRSNALAIAHVPAAANAASAAPDPPVTRTRTLTCCRAQTYHERPRCCPGSLPRRRCRHAGPMHRQHAARAPVRHRARIPD